MIPRPRKFGPLSYSVATDMDRTIVLTHNFRFDAWRFRLELSIQTQASVDNVRWWDGYDALRQKAVAAWGDRDHVQWAMDDHWDNGGSREGALALLSRIADGVERNPWAEPEAVA